MKKNIFICLAILSCTQVQAQNRWSLRQCIDYAIEHNIDIRRTANAAEQSNIEVNTAKWARLPNLNANAGQNWNWGRTQTAIKDENTGDYSTVYVNTASHGTNMSVSTSIPLFTGLEIPNQYALAKLNLKAALADLEKAKEDISINIASAYLQVLFNEELHRVSLGQVELSKEQCNRIERLAESLSGGSCRSQSTRSTGRNECCADRQQLSIGPARSQPAHRAGDTGRIPFGRSNRKHRAHSANPSG